MTETEAAVMETVASEFNMPDGADMDRETRLCEDLGLDVLDTTELIMSVEKRFKVNLDHISIDDVATIGDLVDLVEAQSNDQKGKGPEKAEEA